MSFAAANFWLLFGGIWLFCGLLFAPSALAEPQTERRPESSTTPMSSPAEEMTLLLYQHAPDGTGHTYGTGWYDGNENQLPDDLATLLAAILTIKSTVLKVCKQ